MRDVIIKVGSVVCQIAVVIIPFSVYQLMDQLAPGEPVVGVVLAFIAFVIVCVITTGIVSLAKIADNTEAIIDLLNRQLDLSNKISSASVPIPPKPTPPPLPPQSSSPVPPVSPPPQSNSPSPSAPPPLQPGSALTLPPDRPPPPQPRSNAGAINAPNTSSSSDPKKS